jgi:hypothetical protein
MTTLDVKLSVSDEVMEYLRREAVNRNVPLDVVVSEVLADYFDEPTKDEILTSLRVGMRQALAGNYRPAHEVLDEIEREMVDDADEG